MMTADSSLEEAVVEVMEFQRTHYFGKYRGTVKTVLTGGDLGKLTLRVPGIYDDKDSPPAWPCVPFAGKKHGLLLLPEPNDCVWVEFEGGDPSRPIWTGGWWPDNAMPDPKGEKVRTWVTSAGMKVVLDDDKKKLQIIHPGGGEITMTDNDVTVKYKSTEIKLSQQSATINGMSFQVST